MLEFLDAFEGHTTYYTRLVSPVINTADGNELRPWLYVLEKYRPDMLQLPMLSTYDSYGEHGLRYVERCDRQGENAHCGHTEKGEVKM